MGKKREFLVGNPLEIRLEEKSNFKWDLMFALNRLAEKSNFKWDLMFALK